MTSDVVVCTEECCSSIDTFLCVKHCQRYVCYEHLQEHHRRYEKEKNDLPKDLQRRIQQRVSLYNRLIDEKKLNEQEKRDIEIACTEIRRTYVQRRQEHRQFQHEGTLMLEQAATIKDLKSYLEKLDVAIEREQQREQIYSQTTTPTNIKLEPHDFNDQQSQSNFLTPASSANGLHLSTDQGESQSQSSWPEDGEEQSDQPSSEIDSEYEDHRKHSSSPTNSSKQLNQSVALFRAACPLTRPGLFGILPSHNVRLCEGKPSCLYNHLQSFHHMTARAAYRVCKAILKERDALSTILFDPEEILYNRHFHIACPFNEDEKNPFDCQPKYIQKAPCPSIISRLDMPRHLRDVHHVYRDAALKIVAEVRRCSKSAESFNRNLFDQRENIIETPHGKNSTVSKSVKRRRKFS